MPCRSSPVGIGVIDIRQFLIICKRVDSGDLSIDQGKGIIERLSQWCEAVGCATGITNHLHVIGEDGIVHTVDNGCVDILDGRTDDDFLGASLDVGKACIF